MDEEKRKRLWAKLKHRVDTDPDFCVQLWEKLKLLAVEEMLRDEKAEKED